MANYTAADVKKLRELTGSGMMACKKALEESEGDFDKAVEILVHVDPVADRGGVNLVHRDQPVHPFLCGGGFHRVFEAGRAAGKHRRPLQPGRSGRCLRCRGGGGLTAFGGGNREGVSGLAGHQSVSLS